MSDLEAAGLLEINRYGRELVMAGDRHSLVAWLESIRREITDDIQSGLDRALADAPLGDRALLDDGKAIAAAGRGILEALALGVEGWADECVLLLSDWIEIQPTSIHASVTWWHGCEDSNCPLAAARRLVGLLGNARLLEVEDAGHDITTVQASELLDELLSRFQAVQPMDTEVD
jgi:pimeloyl-ACP methyl ester carboxylesterase